MIAENNRNRFAPWSSLITLSAPSRNYCRLGSIADVVYEMLLSAKYIPLFPEELFHKAKLQLSAMRRQLLSGRNTKDLARLRSFSKSLKAISGV